MKNYNLLLREEFEEKEDRYLHPAALRSCMSRGRAHREPQHEFRPVFQRDKERISYSTAFRRLEYKTQVFVNHEGDHYRTRLTHTLEVALVARSIARGLRLNEDAVEAIALAHDLGHSPFGHAGEGALNELMLDEGGFEHNMQSLRIVEELEDCYVDFKGLNLTWEVREGLKKHTVSGMNALEFQVVNIADEIAYNGHDLDDGLRSGYLELGDVQKLAVWQYIFPEGMHFCEGISNYILKALITRRLINAQILDVIRHTSAGMESIEGLEPELVYALKTNTVCFSPQMRAMIDELRAFLFDNLYKHEQVMHMSDKGIEVLRFLFSCYQEHRDNMPGYFVKRCDAIGAKRTICDYIAGMTDRYAYKEYEKLKKMQ